VFCHVCSTAVYPFHFFLVCFAVFFSVTPSIGEQELFIKHNEKTQFAQSNHNAKADDAQNALVLSGHRVLKAHTSTEEHREREREREIEREAGGGR